VGADGPLGELRELTRRLRAECPWDREQTARTIVPHTVEEAYEVADAAFADDPAKLLDELGADPVGVGLRLHEDVTDGARFGNRVVRAVLLVVALDVRIRDLRVGGHLLVDPLGEEL